MGIGIVTGGETAFEPATDAVVILDVDGRIVEFDAAAEQAFGLSCERVRGRPLVEAIMTPRDRIGCHAAFLQWTRTGDPTPARRVRFSGCRADGREFPAALTVTRVPRLDPPLFVGLITDLSDRRRAERRRVAHFRVAAVLAAARSLAEAAPPLLEALLEAFDASVACLWTIDGGALVCAATAHAPQASAGAVALASEWRGRRGAPGEDLPGRAWQTAVPQWSGGSGTAGAAARGAEAAGVDLHGAFAFPVCLGAQVLAVLEFFFAAPQDAGEEAHHLMGNVGHQIAQFLARETAEADREQALEREHRARLDAERANHAKDEFLAIVSHELRTPLNAVLGWATLLKSGALDQQKRTRAVDAIERGARAQAQLIDDLLDVSRAIRGKLTIERVEIDAAAVARAALDLVQPTAQQRRVALRTDGLDRPAPILGDRTRLQQVIWNLLSNAVKFTPADGVVALLLHVGDGQVVLSVEDTGAGIHPELLPHLFERFSQGALRGGRAQGLGLGLAIVRHIVEVHGGTVTAESDGEGRGSRFTVRLPAAPDLHNT